MSHINQLERTRKRARSVLSFGGRQFSEHPFLESTENSQKMTSIKNGVAQTQSNKPLGMTLRTKVLLAIVGAATGAFVSHLLGVDWIAICCGDWNQDRYLQRLPYTHDQELLNGKRRPDEKPYWTDRPAQLQGKFFRKTIVMIPKTDTSPWATWEVPRGYGYFVARLALHDPTDPLCATQGSVRFIVQLDEQPPESIRVDRNSGPVPLSLSLSDSEKLTLKTDASGDGNTCDEALWIDARFTKTESDNESGTGPIALLSFRGNSFARRS